MQICGTVRDCIFATQIIGDIRRGEKNTKKWSFLLYRVLLFEALVKTKNKAFLWAF